MIRRTRKWVPWVKRILLALRLAKLAKRGRGRAEWAEYTGGWNAPESLSHSSQQRLNLGCGQANYQGYINMDIDRLPHLHAQAAGQSLPFRSETFDEVLCTDVIEHLDVEQGQFLFEEVSRVLRQGGHFILVTPDLDNIVRVYRSGFASHDQIVQHLLGDLRDHRYLYTIPILTQQINSTGLSVQRSIPQWGPIWAHMVILAKKA